MLRHRDSNTHKEIQIQRRRGMVLLPGMGITRGKKSPLIWRGVFPGDALKFYSRLSDLAPFLFDALALVAAQLGKKSVKVAIAWICLLYTSDAADDLLCVDLGGR